MIKAVRKDDEFLADVEQARKERGKLHLWWLGQAGFLVQWQGHHLLLDPYLSDSLTAKYASTATPHVRMSERVIDPRRLDFIDVVSSSHNHTDHLDHETLWPLREANPDLRFVIPEANRSFVANRLQCDPSWPIGCDDGRSVQVGPFALIGLASAHETLERDAKGRYKHLGYIIRGDRWSIYHSGDAVPYQGMAERLRQLAAPHAVDVALLPINGRAPERGVPGNFSATKRRPWRKTSTRSW